MRISPDGTVIDPQGFLISNSPVGETDPNVASRGSDTLIVASQMLNDGVHSAYRVTLSEVLSGINRFPVAVASASVVTGDVPLSVDFSSTGSVDPEGSALTYLWQFADDTSSAQENPAHNYTSPGEYPAVLTVFDNLGQAATQALMINATAPNQLPVVVASASRVSGPAPLSTIFYADGSYDPDGKLGNIEWRLNGNAFYYGSPAYKTFSDEGTYPVTLRVYDSRGDFGETTLTITVGGINQPPVAEASATPASGDAPLNVNFSSSGSSDVDGSIVSYSWDFGDGSSGAGANPSHLYTSLGTYPVVLTVTDNSGASASASVTITVDGVSAAALRTAISMSSSKKRGIKSVNAIVTVSNGIGGVERSAILQGKWTFPDGTITSRYEYSDSKGKANFSVSANADGVYQFEIITVTKSGFAWDKGGSEISDSFTLGTVAENQPPTAVFSDSCTELSCLFDGSGSSDSDGSIVAYSWNFGDGNSAGSVSPNHNYAAAGSYTVSLTVSDNEGATDGTSRVISVTDDPTPSVVVHVGDLDGGSEPASKGRWAASVTIAVHDANEAPVAGVTVSGGWSDGANGSGNCVTTTNGDCTIGKANLKKSAGSVTFTVNDAVASNTSYNFAANHDPDGDSNGTVIIVSK